SGGAQGNRATRGNRLIATTATSRAFRIAFNRAPILELRESVISALKKRPRTKKVSVAIPAKTAAKREVPYEAASRRYSTRMGGKDRTTVVNEFISTFAAKISLGFTGDVKT